MKKLLILASAMAVLTMVGCKGGEQQGESQNDSTQMVDSSSSIASEYASPDLAFYALKGQVKEVFSVTYEVDENYDVEKAAYDLKDTLRFTSEGQMTVFSLRDADLTDPMFKDALTRNEKGQVVKYQFELKQSENHFDDRAMTWDGDDTFTLDEQGRLVKWQRESYEGDGDLDFTYDEKGLEKTLHHAYSAEGTDFDDTSTFEYVSFDDQGNWTERKILTVSKYTEYEGKPTESKEYQVEKRTIIYY